MHVICYPQPNRTKTQIVSLFKGTKVPALLEIFSSQTLLCLANKCYMDSDIDIYNKNRKVQENYERTEKRNIYIYIS